jgi:modulator of FtsH protease
MVTLIHQRLSTLGAEVLAFSLCGAWLQSVSAKNAFAARMQLRRPLWESILHAVLGQVQLLPFVVGAVLLLNGHDRGFYWIASGCIAIFIVSVWNAWVLLVEILR